VLAGRADRAQSSGGRLRIGRVLDWSEQDGEDDDMDLRTVSPDAPFVIMAVIIGGVALLLRVLIGLGPDRETRKIWMGGNVTWPLTHVRRFLAAIAIVAGVLAATGIRGPRGGQSSSGQGSRGEDVGSVGTGTNADMHGDQPPYAVRLTTASCREIGVALGVFHSRYARYPAALTDSLFLSILLVRPVTYLLAPTDGWDLPFQFVPGAGEYRLSSAGPDGVNATGDEIVCTIAPSS
jgi:hypothetical protein